MTTSNQPYTQEDFLPQNPQALYSIGQEFIRPASENCPAMFCKVSKIHNTGEGGLYYQFDTLGSAVFKESDIAVQFSQVVGTETRISS